MHFTAPQAQEKTILTYLGLFRCNTAIVQLAREVNTDDIVEQSGYTTISSFTLAEFLWNNANRCQISQKIKVKTSTEKAD